MADSKLTENSDILQIDNFGIGENTITWGNTTLQLSNVSGISTYKYVEKTPFPKLSILFIAIGFGLLSLPSWSEIKSFGWIALLAGIAWIGLWWYANNNPNKTLALYIMMNSGMTYAIGFESETGLKNTVKRITKIINEHNNNTTNNFNGQIEVYSPITGTWNTQNFNSYVDQVTQINK